MTREQRTVAAMLDYGFLRQKTICAFFAALSAALFALWAYIKANRKRAVHNQHYQKVETMEDEGL